MIALGSSLGDTMRSSTRKKLPTSNNNRTGLTKRRSKPWILILGISITVITLVRWGQQPGLQIGDSFVGAAATSLVSSSQADVVSGLPPPFHLIRKMRGSNWKAWHISSDDGILHPDKGFPECRWGVYTSQYDPTKSMNACLHPTADLISDTILIRGFWEDCHAVSRQWYAAADEDNATTTSTNNNHHHIHIEIGANIGSCIFELLLSAPDAYIVAFEPQSRNLFRLTSTLKAAPAHLSNRVVIMPIALGAPTGGEQTVQLAAGDKAALGKVNYGGNFITTGGIKDAEGTAMEDVAMERLGDILPGPSSSSMVRLMKIDAQGFECNILDGMPLELVPERIVTEVEVESLTRSGCSREGLLNRLAQHSYVASRYRGATGKLAAIPTDGDFTVVGVRQSP